MQCAGFDLHKKEEGAVMDKPELETILSMSPPGREGSHKDLSWYKGRVVWEEGNGGKEVSSQRNIKHLCYEQKGAIVG
jgi:hypothetical protein